MRDPLKFKARSLPSRESTARGGKHEMLEPLSVSDSNVVMNWNTYGGNLSS
jgi:hypothetical protein